MFTSLAVLLTLAAPDPALVELRAGVLAFEQGRYSKSLQYLGRFEPDAVRLDQQALTWWHLGRAHEELGRPCDALPWFEKAARVPDASTAKAKAAVARIKARTFAEVRVDCATPAVTVRLKGVAGELACPAEWTALAPKRYTLIARVGGRDFPAVPVNARRCNIARVDIEMAGSLRVDSPTPGAVIWLEGTRLGPAPQAVPAMPAGDYAVAIRAPGYHPAKRTVLIPPGGVHEHAAGLVPIPAPSKAELAPKRQGAWFSVFGATGLLGAGGILLYQSGVAQDGSDATSARVAGQADPLRVEALRKQAADEQDEAELKGVVGYSLLAGGVVFAGVATWLFLRDDDTETALMLTPGGAMWQVRW
ncbi:MAG: hypothetical protein ACI9U2_000250 [Bradymonadia bacterium]